MINLFLFLVQLIIKAAIVIGIILLLAYILLEPAFAIASRWFDASYKYNSRDFKKKKKFPPQNNKYEFIFNEGLGEYQIRFGEQRTLTKGTVKIHHQGFIYSSRPRENEKTLILKEKSEREGNDRIGKYHLLNLKWQFEDLKIEIITNFYLYEETSYIIFEQYFPVELKDIETGNFKTPITYFPCFENKSPNKRILTYKNAIFFPPSRKIDSNMAPVAFFDDECNTFLLCSMNNFLVSYIHQNKKTREISGSLNGELKEIPANYSQRFILYFNKGINESFEKMGNLLLKFHDSKRKSPYDCPTLKYLGYWTDNGAYYYYRTEKGLNYEETILKLNEYFDQEQIPIKYIQLDSWWYKKAAGVIFRALFFLPVNGCYLWEPREKIFSKGMKALQERVKKPFCCHARWFASTSPYVKQYDFEINDNLIKWGLPDSQEFWNDLMTEAKSWNLQTYEQDWMNNQYKAFKTCRNNVSRARRWLYHMASAAQKQGITIQYCMANPGMILHSIEFPSVTHARTSNDYNSRLPKKFYYPCFTQANIFIKMVGIWPSKDNFFSTTGPSLFYREKYPVLETLLSCLSGGVVGPADKIGFLNKELLMKTCRSDGVLLKPDRPLTPIDLMFVPNRKYYLNSTESVKNSLKWEYILVMNIWPRRVKDKSFTLRDFGIENERVLYDFHNKILRKINIDEPIVQYLKKNQHAYYIAAPIFENKISFIGNPEKFITCSNLQFPMVIYENGQLIIKINELKEHEISLLFYTKTKPGKLDIEGANILTEHYNEPNKKYEIRIKMQEEKAEIKI
ncbi:MAG: hypothetical protein ACTSVE_04865 [Candidatus Helarchaeota archaeon]